MIQTLSETVIIPIAGMILTFILCYVPPLSGAELKEVTLKEAERLVTELKALEAPNNIICAKQSTEL